MKTEHILLYCALLLCLPGNLLAQTPGKNYILTRTFTNEAGSTYLDEIQYFNGLGQPSQTVQKQVTPSLKDIVTLFEYDAAGREVNNWLPGAVSTATGEYVTSNTVKTAAGTTHTNYSPSTGSKTADAAPYAKVEYEKSMLNRPAGQYGPGNAWHANSKKVKTEYFTNAVSGDLACTRYLVSGAKTACALSKPGSYGNNQLFVVQTTDEDGNISFTFTDKLGQTLLVRRKVSGVSHDTYYAYDDFGNLCYVLPPEAVDKLTAYGDTDPVMKQYAFMYKYDGWNRCVAKKLPGCEWEYFVYDYADRMIYSQDGEQRVSGVWMFNIPDVFGRTVLAGTCTNSLNWAGEPLGTAFVKADWAGGTNALKGYSTSGVTLSSPMALTANYYDSYAFMGLNGIPASSDTNFNYETASGYGTQYTNSYKGLLTGTWRGLMNESTTTTISSAIHTILYYDYLGRIIQTKANNHLTGGIEKEYIGYNFAGLPLARKHIHSATGKTTQTEEYAYTYDHAGRLKITTLKLNGASAISLSDNTYDEAGRLLTQTKGGNATSLKSTYYYNVRSWTQAVTGALFTENLYYNDSYGGSTARYNGNIGAMSWKLSSESQTRGYNFTYDGLSRLTAANYLENGTANTNYSTSYSYDKHGNIKTLERRGKVASTTYGIIDKLTTTLDGNRITRVTDAGTNVTMPESADFKDYAAGSGTYTYNNYGTLTKDSQKGILHISYNFIHLPKELAVRNTNAVGKTYYTYSADGVKRQVKHLTSTNLSYTPVTGTGGDANFNVTRTTDFAGNVVYENGSLKRISTEGGYIEGGVWYYYLTDHLGNNRVVANAAGTVVQKTHYYPYGMAFAENTTAEQGLQPYKYNGKELDPMHGTNLYDYAARMMDPALGRFTSMDPLAEKYYDWSPYAYVANNPLRYVDPTGMAIDDPEEEIRKKSMLERLINSFNNLFSLSIDTSSPETINASANQLEANRQTVQQATSTINTVSDAISMVMPLSSVAEVAANADTGNTGAAWAAVPFAVLDVATMGEGRFAIRGARTAVKEGITVLGHYPEYVKLAESIGARRFQIPTSVWNSMSVSEQWGANTKFLDRMILRGDNIRLATPLYQVKPGSFYQKELNYLFDKGYKVSPEGLRLVK